ncbi:MAG: OmpP1/FadL family transporter, partial [Cetobacterium somerae]
MKFKQQLMLLVIVLSANSMGVIIDYLSQQDAEYLAHPAMVGKIGVSGAYYNPAGTVWLEDGT